MQVGFRTVMQKRDVSESDGEEVTDVMTGKWKSKRTRQKGSKGKFFKVNERFVVNFRKKTIRHQHFRALEELEDQERFFSLMESK